MVPVLSPLLCWFALPHLSPSDKSRRFNLEMGFTREHVAQQPSRAQLCAPPWPVISSWSPAFQLGWAPPCRRTASYIVFRLRGAGKLALIQGDKLSSCQAFLAVPATTSVVQFQGHWNIPIGTQNIPLLPPPTAPIMGPEPPPLHKCIPLT